MTYKLNKKHITREQLLKVIDENYLTYIETVAKNLFEFGCYEYVDEIPEKLSISIMK